MGVWDVRREVGGATLKKRNKRRNNSAWHRVKGKKVTRNERRKKKLKDVIRIEEKNKTGKKYSEGQ